MFSTTSLCRNSSGCWKHTSPSRHKVALVPDGHAAVAENKFALPREIRNSLDGNFPGIVFTGATTNRTRQNAFFQSPVDEAAILTMDGVGEWDTASIGIGVASIIPS